MIIFSIDLYVVFLWPIFFRYYLTHRTLKYNKITIRLNPRLFLSSSKKLTERQSTLLFFYNTVAIIVLLTFPFGFWAGKPLNECWKHHSCLRMLFFFFGVIFLIWVFTNLCWCYARKALSHLSLSRVFQISVIVTANCFDYMFLTLLLIQS